MKSGGEKITPEAFYQQLAQVGGPDLVAFARWAVENAPAHGLSVAWGNAGPLLRFAYEKHPHLPFMFGQLDSSGVLAQRQSAVLRHCEELHVPVEIIRDYLKDVAALIPGACVKTFPLAGGDVKELIVSGEDAGPVDWPRWPCTRSSGSPRSTGPSCESARCSTDARTGIGQPECRCPRRKWNDHPGPCQENRLVTKREIVQTIAKELGLTQHQAQQIVQTTFASIINILVADGRVELRNFGVFEVRWRKPREARNPRTGKKVMVPAKCTAIFKPGMTMQARVEEKNRTAAMTAPVAVTSPEYGT
jgi:nucleoid DNA-binding protein